MKFQQGVVRMRYSAKVLSVVALFLFLSWPQGQAAVFC